MNVHVGTDVHPKRSQIAVLDAAGGEQRSRNLPNDPVKLVPVLDVLPPGTPVAFEAAYGWAWLWSSGGVGPGAAPGPSQPLQGDRRRPAQER